MARAAAAPLEDDVTGFVRPFAQDEYDWRVESVRAGMAVRGLDLLIVTIPENVTYLTGYETIGYASYQVLAIPLSGDPLLMVREMERTVAETTSWVPRVETFGDTDDAVDVTRRILSARGLLAGRGHRVGLEDTGWFLSPAAHARLRAALGEGVQSGSGLVEHARRIKSAAEIEWIRAACRLTEAGMQAAFDTIAPGRTENQVASAAYSAMVGGGSDFLVGDPIVTSGWRSGVGHFTFANRVLETGDTILLEFGACRRRYFGPLMRSAVVGPPAPEVARMGAVIIAALDAAIVAIRPGATSGAVDQACRGVIEAAGLEPYFRKRTGYSVGVAYAPDWGEGHIISLRRDDPTVLEPGMVFHIPPALRVPRQYGLGMSETVLVTAGGCEVLTRFPRRIYQA
jgi:Xaa-Pro dipeptidase